MKYVISTLDRGRYFYWCSAGIHGQQWLTSKVFADYFDSDSPEDVAKLGDAAIAATKGKTQITIEPYEIRHQTA